MKEDENKQESLTERIERLEEAVAELKRLHVQDKAASQSDVGIPPSKVETGQVGPTEPTKSGKKTTSRRLINFSEEMTRSDYWLNKIGIGLLLFGVAFLFKYSIDQGWLTPEVRIGFGLALGIFLIVTGIRIYPNRKHFSRVLAGGGIAVFYITGFAAFQVFELVSHSLAFAFMILSTAVSFSLSIKQHESALSIIGTIGGLGTPFLLYTGESNVPGLVGYTCLVLAGSMAIYYFQHWTSLLWVSVIGGWTVLLIGLNSVLPGRIAAEDQWALQIGIAYSGLVFWIIPIVSEILPVKRAGPGLENELITSPGTRSKQTVLFLTVITPLIGMSLSRPIWSLSQSQWGWIVMLIAAIFAVAILPLVRLRVRENLSYAHAFSCVVLLTISFDLLMDGNQLLFVLALEALGLHWLAHGRNLKKIGVLAHILSILIGIWMIQRLLDGHVDGDPILNLDAITDLWILAVALIVSFILPSTDERRFYLLYVHVGILVFFLRELSALTSGQGYVTVVWGIYAVLLLVFGLRKNIKPIRTAAIATLLVVVGKLFLVDLARLEAIWRILLFLGFGGLFLLLSYYFQSWWKVSVETGREHGDA